MALGIRCGAPARPVSEARDADPTHGSCDSQAFLQPEIGGPRHWEGWMKLGNRWRIPITVLVFPQDLSIFRVSNVMECLGEAVCAVCKPCGGFEDPASRSRPDPQKR